MYDASDRKHVRRAEKSAKLAEQSRGTVIKSIADSEAGRRYLWDRLTAAHVFTTSFDDSPTRMAFAEGERNQGLQLLNDIIQFCPEQFIQAMREENGRRTTTGERSGDEDGDGGDQGSSSDPSDRDAKAA